MDMHEAYDFLTNILGGNDSKPQAVDLDYDSI